MKLRFISGLFWAVQKEYFTTEYCYPLRDSLEFHGEEAEIIFNSVLLRVLCGLFLTYLTSLKERLA